MKDVFVNLIKLSLSILIVLFVETYFYKLLGLIGIHLAKSAIITLIIYIIEFILIYIIYGREVSSAFSKYQNKFGNNVLYTIISYIVIFIAMMITNYILKIIANNINLPYHGLNFTNIFDKTFNFDFIVTFLINIIIIPFVKIAIFVLGINNLMKGKSGIFFSGFIYALYEAFLIGGTFGNVFIDVVDEFVLFILLSYIYRKNSNIAFSIITFIFYELFSALLITKLF